jgi:hypothetical protein
MLTYVLMALGFGVVILGAELLIRGSSALARQLKVSDLAIGLTVVAFGTSFPELTTSAVACMEGQFGNRHRQCGRLEHIQHLLHTGHQRGDQTASVRRGTKY